MSYVKLLHRQLDHAESGFAVFGSDYLPIPAPVETGDEVGVMRIANAARHNGVRLSYSYGGPQVASPVDAYLSVYRWDDALQAWQPAMLERQVSAGDEVLVALPGMPIAEAVIMGVMWHPVDPHGTPGVYLLGMDWEPVRDGTPMQFNHTSAKAVPFGSVEAVASSRWCQSVMLQAPETNPGIVYVGGSTDAASLIANGGRLPPGAGMSIEVDNVNKVYCTGSIGGCELRVLYS